MIILGISPIIGLVEVSKIWSQDVHLNTENTEKLQRVYEKLLWKLGMMAHTYNSGTWEAETRGSEVRGQPQHFSEALRKLVRPCFKIKSKIGLGV